MDVIMMLHQFILNALRERVFYEDLEVKTAGNNSCSKRHTFLVPFFLRFYSPLLIAKSR